VGSTALTWWLGGGAYHNRVYLGSDTRLAEMAIGAVLAVVILGRGPSTSRRRWAQVGRVSLDAIAAAAALAVVAFWVLCELGDGWLYRWGLALHAVLVAVVIAAAVQPGTLVRRVLSVRPLTALGRISYGAYLLHWPVFLWLTPERLGLDHRVAPFVQSAITIAAATLSYRLIETPIRSGRRVLSWRRVAVPALAVGTLAVLAAILPTADPSHLTALDDTEQIRSSRQLQSAARMFVPTTTAVERPATQGAASATSTTVPPPPPPVRVLFSGDSFAMSLIPGIHDYVEHRTDFGFITAAMVGCGFGRGGRNRGIGLDVTYSRECQHRDEWLTAAIGHLHPDVVVFAGGLWDVTDRKPPGFSHWTHIGDPAYDRYLVGEIRHLVSLVGVEGAQIVWLDAPHWNPKYTPANFMGRPPYAEADPARADRFNAVLLQALAGLPNVRILDIAGWLRSQPGGEFGPTVRADGVHLTTTSSADAARWLVPQLIQIGRESPVPLPPGAAADVGDLTSPGS
jgi:hypothetical protein